MWSAGVHAPKIIQQHSSRQGNLARDLYDKFVMRESE